MSQQHDRVKFTKNSKAFMSLASCPESHNQVLKQCGESKFITSNLLNENLIATTFIYTPIEQFYTGKLRELNQEVLHISFELFHKF